MLKALWLVVASHLTKFNKSECFISEWHNYTMLKFVSAIRFLRFVS